MNKNGLQVLENIYAAQRLILMTGVDIIKTFSDGEMWKPLFYLFLGKKSPPGGFSKKSYTQFHR